MASGESTKVVVAAMVGNGLIAASKFVAAAFTGSAAMLAEAVHSVADTGNQALLMLGMRLSKKGPTETHPFGRAVERYFWPFVVSIMLFTVGGVFAIYEGIHGLAEVQTVASEAMSKRDASVLWNYGVLGAAILFEGYAFTVAMKEFAKIKGERGTLEAVIGTKDPTIPVVLMEDSAALAGLLVALAGVALGQVTGWQGWDAIASLVIGVLLCVVAVVLAKDTHSLILGESATAADRRKVRDIVCGVDGIEEVTQLLSMHRGPEDVLLALKVSFRRGLAVGEVERLIDRAEARIREELPHMRHIFIEADASYEVAQDAARAGAVSGSSEG